MARGNEPASIIYLCIFWVLISSCSTTVPSALLPPPLPVQRQDGKVESTLFPLPVVASDPNCGNDYGILPVWIFPRDDKSMGLILAPSAIYNNVTKPHFAFRLLAFPAPGTSYKLIADQSTGVTSYYEYQYNKEALKAQDWSYSVRLFQDSDITARFYGLGNTTPEDNETSYTSRSLNAQASIGYQFTDGLALTWRERITATHLSNKALPGLPPTAQLFPSVMQDMRNTTSAHRLTLSYDTRNVKETPTCGFLGSIYAETALNTLGSDASYDRLGLDLKGFQPWDADHRFVTAFRLMTELMTRQRNTPFYELPTLGGFETNRGYGDDRFIDRNMIAFSLEQRIRIFTMHHYGVDSHWEVAPFLDVGKVFPTVGRFNIAHLHTTGGISFRAVVRPTIVGHVDIGVGREGNAIFMGLGYPF